MAQVTVNNVKQDYSDESFLSRSFRQEPAIDLSGCLPLYRDRCQKWHSRGRPFDRRELHQSNQAVCGFRDSVGQAGVPRMSSSTQRNSEAPDSRLIFLPHSLRRDATRQAGATDPALLQGDRRLYRRTAMMALAIHTMIRGSSIPSVRWASTRRPSDSSAWLGVLAIFALFWRTCKFWSSAYDRDHG
jgi:hypothetical protein